jgi:hypothetical protein
MSSTTAAATTTINASHDKGDSNNVNATTVQSLRSDLLVIYPHAGHAWSINAFLWVAWGSVEDFEVLAVMSPFSQQTLLHLL